MATKAKALFDYLYLRSDLHRRNAKKLKQQLNEIGIQWANFSEEDFKEFDHYVWKSNASKMMKIWHILNDHYWAKELLK